jgi:hypothetical protein
MEFKIIKTEEIIKHDEFDAKYMNQLYVCKEFLTKDEIKEECYCSKQCHNNCFAKQKHYFEQYVAFIRNPEAMYVERIKDGAITYIRPTCMTTRFQTLSKWVNMWMRIDDKLTFSALDFYPDKSKCPKDIYNIFNDFRIKKIYVKNDDQKKKELLKPILDHFDDSFESKAVVNYLLNQFAHSLQFPMDKSRNGVSLVFQGEQGTGKSFIIDEMLMPLFGEKYYFYTCKPSDLAGDHSEAMPNRLIVTLDEVNGKTSFDIAEVLKSFITQTRLQVNPKGIRPYTVNNYCRYYFTTNRKTPLKMEIGDRRYFATRMLNTHINDKGYYAKLSEYMKRPDVLSAWFDHLMSLDVKDYDFNANRPFSKIYNDMIEACVPNTTKFLADMIGKVEQEFINEDKVMPDDHIEKVGATSLFTLYGNWKTKTNHKDDHNTTSFGREITSIEGIIKERKTDGIIYKIEIKAIKKYFSKNNLFGYEKPEIPELSEIEKLREIIKNQKLEIERYQKLLINTKISSEDVDHDNTYIENITINIFNNNYAQKPKQNDVTSDQLKELNNIQNKIREIAKRHGKNIKALTPKPPKTGPNVVNENIFNEVYTEITGETLQNFFS